MQNFEELLKIGENLDSLMDKSKDLKLLTRNFYRKTNKINNPGCLNKCGLACC